MSDVDAVAEPLLARLRAADWKAREAIKDELLAAMRAFSDRDSAIRCLEEARKTLDLERRWDVDEVIEARQTRPRLIRMLDVLKTKRDKNPPKKHGNLPL